MILIVDDEPFYFRSYRDTLEDEGFEIAFSLKLAGAMSLIERSPETVELIITDVMMPSGGLFKRDDLVDPDLVAGFGFFAWVRERLPSVPLIVLTNKPTDDVNQVFGKDKHCLIARKSLWNANRMLRYIKDTLHLKGTER